MLSDDGRPSSDEAISVCDDDGLPALDWNAGRLNLSFRLLLYYLRLTINFLCDVSVLWIMLDYVDILSPVSLAECIIILISLFSRFGFSGPFR